MRDAKHERQHRKGMQRWRSRTCFFGRVFLMQFNRSNEPVAVARYGFDISISPCHLPRFFLTPRCCVQDYALQQRFPSTQSASPFPSRQGAPRLEWKAVRKLFRRAWEIPDVRLAWDGLVLEYGDL